MKHVARPLLVVLVVAALVLWLGSSPTPRVLLITVVIAAIVLGFRASVQQKRMERQWIKWWLTKWRSQF